MIITAPLKKIMLALLLAGAAAVPEGRQGFM